MTKSERRKIYCSVLFHVLAIVCMLWSVYVLVKRTAEEIRLGKNGQYAPPPFLFMLIYMNVFVVWQCLHWSDSAALKINALFSFKCCRNLCVFMVELGFLWSPTLLLHLKVKRKCKKIFQRI